MTVRQVRGARGELWGAEAALRVRHRPRGGRAVAVAPSVPSARCLAVAPAIPLSAFNTLGDVIRGALDPKVR
ncbi:hypothetical protein ACIBO9_37425 [Streptomyces prunicolor]|uniref:hypothetical protein n=1 Tax=Streptomyces prunicolor TaxID=67348 RepID=UPI0037D4B44D